ncbi:MAG: hypothetical protein ABFC94_19005 [Syntrophomonas sp.]
MNIWPVKRWGPGKSTRINFNWHKVVLQDKVLPELEMVARAQAIYDMGMGIPPAGRVIKDGLTGQEVVVVDDKEFYCENGWDDYLLARAIILKKPENLPEWVIGKCWDKKNFRNELNRYVNQMTSNSEARVAYWMDLRIMQSIKLKKSGPEAVLGFTHKILVGMYLAMAE